MHAKMDYCAMFQRLSLIGKELAAVARSRGRDHFAHLYRHRHRDKRGIYIE